MLAYKDFRAQKKRGVAGAPQALAVLNLYSLELRLSSSEPQDDYETCDILYSFE